MSQPVKLSDGIVIDARVAAELQERSIAGQVEHWAQLGRAIEPYLNLVEVIALKKSARGQSLQSALDSVEKPEGRKSLAEHLDSLPFPHYASSPTYPGYLVRTEENGLQTVGRFVKRQFILREE